MGKKRTRDASAVRPVADTSTAPGVKPETMWLAVVVAFAVGFLSGVVFTIYRSPQQQTADALPVSAPAPATTGNDAQIEMLKRHLAHEAGDLKSWIELGNLCFDSGRYDDAALAYEKALAIDDTNADVWTDLGVMYRRQGRPQKAIEAFDHAIAVDNRHEVARFNKGVVLMHDLSRAKDAVAAWEQLLAINPLARTPDGQSLDEQVTRLKKQTATPAASQPAG